MGLNYGAYMTEIFRAGIQSVSHGQSEAAEALGMTYRQKMKRVVLPQAFRVIIPPTGNEFIAMMKDTALVSFIGVSAEQAEIFRRAQLAGARDFNRSRPICSPPGCTGPRRSSSRSSRARLERRIGKGYVRGDTGKRTKIVATSGQGGEGGAVAAVIDEPIGRTRAAGTGALR